MAEPTGQVFAGYEILAKIGQGGTGAVYRARQPLLNRIVAIKILWPHLSGDKTFVTRFIREASTAASLHHPNMVLVHTAGEYEGVHHIVMEFVEGKSLHEHITSQGRLDPCEAVAITVQVCQALQYAWKQAQLIHRDIKPANIFLSTAGEVKLGDLGLAKSQGQSCAGATLTGTVMGSPHYMSPEQARALKNIDFRADIYSLGCTLYHMLTGQPPYQGDSSLAIVMKQINGRPPAIFKVWPQCPPALGRLVNKMLAKRPQRRPQSYEELIAKLMAVHDELKTDAENTPSESVGRKPFSPALRYSIAGLFAAALLAGLLWWTLSRRHAPLGQARIQSEQTETVAEPQSPRQQQQDKQATELRGQPQKERDGSATSQVGPKTDSRWTNSLGMPFVPVPDTAVLFSIWETRLKDYEVFDRGSGYNTPGYDFIQTKSGRPKFGGSWRFPGFVQTPEHPVCYVSWEDALEFCRWLTAKERAQGYLRADQGYRLPTDAEWSTAVGLLPARNEAAPEKLRRPASIIYPWGNEWPPPAGAGNYGGEETKQLTTLTGADYLVGYRDNYVWTAPVGSFRPNHFGIYDLGGNVWEWCEDRFPSSSDRRAFRGGSWGYDSPAALMSSNRGSAIPNHRASYRGFRCVLGTVSSKVSGVAQPSSP